MRVKIIISFMLVHADYQPLFNLPHLYFSFHVISALQII